MNHITVSDNSKNQMTSTKANYTDATQPSNMLELFAEELPEQHDKATFSTAGSLASASTFGGTVATASTFSSIS